MKKFAFFLKLYFKNVVMKLLGGHVRGRVSCVPYSLPYSPALEELQAAFSVQSRSQASSAINTFTEG